MNATFQRRGTTIPEEIPDALTDDFTNSPGKHKEWLAFLKRSGLANTHQTLLEVVSNLQPFLEPVLHAARVPQAIEDAEWPMGGPWHTANISPFGR